MSANRTFPSQGVSRRAVLKSLSLTMAGSSGALPFAARAATTLPDKPIRIVVGFPAGGGVDIVARRLTEKMRARTGRTFVIDTKPGALGSLAAADMARTGPQDGSAFLLSPISTTALLPSIMKNFSFDTQKAFIPVTYVASSDLGFAVSNSLGVKSMNAYLSHVKKNPNLATYGTPSAGSTAHFLGMLLAKATGINFVHVPYKGTSPLVVDLRAGHVPAGISTLSELGKMHKQGAVTLLATSGQARSPLTPDVPCFQELGLKRLIVGDGLGLWAMNGTPAAIVQEMRSLVAQAIQEPDLKQAFFDMGFVGSGLTPEAFGQLHEAEVQSWAATAKETAFTLSE